MLVLAEAAATQAQGLEAAVPEAEAAQATMEAQAADFPADPEAAGTAKICML